MIFHSVMHNLTQLHIIFNGKKLNTLRTMAMFLINGNEISFNKTKKRTGKKKQNKKTPQTFDDLGDPAKPVAAKKISPLFLLHSH